jgi:hypothetical protein
MTAGYVAGVEKSGVGVGEDGGDVANFEDGRTRADEGSAEIRCAAAETCDAAVGYGRQVPVMDEMESVAEVACVPSVAGEDDVDHEELEAFEEALSGRTVYLE